MLIWTNLNGWALFFKIVLSEIYQPYEKGKLMKLVCFNDYKVGVADGDFVYDMTATLPEFLNHLPRQRMNYLISNWNSLSDKFKSYSQLGIKLDPIKLSLLAPNPAPQHIFAAPSNYIKHMGELGDRSVTKKGRSAREQGCFLKAPGSLCGPGQTIMLPKDSTRRFDHESEMAIVISKTSRNVPRSEAMNYVFGYSCLIDITMRIENGTFEEERSMRKSFETFTPMGPWIITADDVKDPNILGNRLWVNDQLRQESNTKDMIVGVAELIELVSSVIELQPGDIIATGTPDGVGPFSSGDTLRIEIEKVGSMRFNVNEYDKKSPRPY